jgi:hypothetical protein
MSYAVSQIGFRWQGTEARLLLKHATREPAHMDRRLACMLGNASRQRSSP